MKTIREIAEEYLEGIMPRNRKLHQDDINAIKELWGDETLQEPYDAEFVSKIIEYHKEHINELITEEECRGFFLDGFWRVPSKRVYTIKSQRDLDVVCEVADMGVIRDFGSIGSVGCYLKNDRGGCIECIAVNGDSYDVEMTPTGKYYVEFDESILRKTIYNHRRLFHTIRFYKPIQKLCTVLRTKRPYSEIYQGREMADKISDEIKKANEELQDVLDKEFDVIFEERKRQYMEFHREELEERRAKDKAEKERIETEKMAKEERRRQKQAAYDAIQARAKAVIDSLNTIFAEVSAIERDCKDVPDGAWDEQLPKWHKVVTAKAREIAALSITHERLKDQAEYFASLDGEWQVEAEPDEEILGF